MPDTDGRMSLTATQAEALTPAMLAGAPRPARENPELAFMGTPGPSYGIVCCANPRNAMDVSIAQHFLSLARPHWTVDRTHVSAPEIGFKKRQAFNKHCSGPGRDLACFRPSLLRLALAPLHVVGVQKADTWFSPGQNNSIASTA